MSLVSDLRARVAFSTEPLRLDLRAASGRRQLELVMARGAIRQSDIVLVTSVRDDASRLPHWLDYYRRLGIDHFIVIDNGSTDGTLDLLGALDAVTVFRTTRSFRKSHYAVDWVNGLLGRLRLRNWVLWVDSDEFLVFDGFETQDLHALTNHLDRAGLCALQCTLLDLYSRGRVEDNIVESGVDPLTVCRFYDRSGYHRRRYGVSQTSWIKGGVRGRLFFDGDLDRSPALNKSPLVRWSTATRFVQVAHRLLPDSLNVESEAAGVTGVLLHQKFLASVAEKASDDAHVAEHDPEYQRYVAFGGTAPWDVELSGEFRTSAGLVEEGLLSRIRWHAADAL